MEETELADIAKRLYALPFDDFVAARTAAAKAASAESGRPLAAEVRALPKPSVAAWAVNMLAAHDPETMRHLAELGQRMRAVQTELDAAALRGLVQERRKLLNAAVESARTAAEHEGRRISGAVATEVEQTLRALTADEGAAFAVQSGRLLRVLTADGVDRVELDGAVAVPSASVPTAHDPSALVPEGSGPGETGQKSAPRAGPAVDKPRLRAVRPARRDASPSALEKAHAALDEADTAARDAIEGADQQRGQLEDASAEVEQLTAETRQLRARLKHLEEQLERARKLQESAAAETGLSARAADKAQRAAMLARERVLRLGNTPD
ncbi:hypothetical protein V3C33_03790 [Micrococcaceae bacterium Sec5.7]